MSCDDLATANPRISARLGQVVNLDADFYRGGVLTDPFAIRKIEIYKTNVAPHNLVTSIPVIDLSDSLYPAPVCQAYTSTPAGDCGTDPIPVDYIAGRYNLPYLVPTDLATPDVYYDVWYYFPTNPCGELGTGDITGCDMDDDTYSDLLLKCCHRFWLYPDAWYCSDKLQTIRFAFEPLDQRFNSPEVRPLEIGLMPLPLYDYNFNLVNPMIPFLQASILVETQSNELIIDNAACRIGIRQGSYRSNPYVIQYDLDTTLFLRGTYRYQIKLAMPDGSSRVSKKFIFSIS